MHNLLTDSLLRVRLSNGVVATLPLPKVYEALAADRVNAFPALRPHQRHAWHAFLAQLGAIALHRAGRDTPPESAEDWGSLLRALTPEFGSDEPWRLIVEDPARPAFMQAPAPKGLGEHRRRVMTPDDLDILVTSKNHDLKQTIALQATPEDWIFALIDLQTMAGFFGAGNYGIARMNGGYSTRPCLGLVPAEGGLGAHLFHDMNAMLAGRNELLNTYSNSNYFKTNDGTALLWLLPWDGSGSLDLRTLDPYFIEICRRVRLRRQGVAIIALTAGSKVPRISAKAAKGDVGDFWTPVSTKDGKALSLSHASLRYDRLVSLLFYETFRHPPAMKVQVAGEVRWRLVARGVAGGQGKTEGYHERTDIAFAPGTVSAFFRKEQRDKIARIASEQMDEIREVNDALRFGIATAASGGKPKVTKADRAHADPYSRRLDAAADARFFPALERRFSAADEAERAASRAALARGMIAAAEQLLDEAIEAVPCTAIHRHRAHARAVSAFWGRLCSTRSVFSDQPEILDRREALDAGT